MAIKSFIFCLLSSLLCMVPAAKSQVVTLNGKVLNNRVYVMSFWEKDKDEFYYKTAQFAYNYSKKFFSKNQCPIYIGVIGYKNYFFVGVDTKYHSYTSDLIFNQVKENEVGLYLTLPDTCIELEQLAKLLDLGFQNYHILKECKSLRISQMEENPGKYIDEKQCEISALLIKSALNSDLSKKKTRFVKRYKLKKKIVCYPSY